LLADDEPLPYPSLHNVESPVPEIHAEQKAGDMLADRPLSQQRQTEVVMRVVAVEEQWGFQGKYQGLAPYGAGEAKSSELKKARYLSLAIC
jgi:hypothetical protein